MPEPDHPAADPFRPPEIPTEVHCLHCGHEYESYLIEWREQPDAKDRPAGFWCCPTPGCGGLGFGFDILPTDPEYRDERGGYCCDDGELSDELSGDNPYNEFEDPKDDSDIPF